MAIPPKSLYVLCRADASHHRKTKETWAKSFTNGLSKVRLNPYIPTTDTTQLPVRELWERDASVVAPRI